MTYSKTKINGSIIEVVPSGREHIKPCPFCGGCGILSHTWTAAYWMECEECGARRDGDSYDTKSRTGHLRSARSALRNWNQRFGDEP